MNFQKRILLILAIVLILAAIGAVAVWAMTPKASSVSFQDILQGEAKFFYVSDNGVEPMDISGVPALFAPYDSYMKIWNFTVVDLDGDENAEAVLSVYGVAGDTGGYLILHQMDGSFYGYVTGYRTFMLPKTDGTYEYSDLTGMVEGGICVITGFTETGFSLDKITYGSGTWAEWDTYVVDHQPATEEAYWQAMDQQTAKPDLIWYAFDSETIETVFGAEIS